ncbi:MAG: UDP-N-acetylglucosamine--N-acetylmuramyl-(pentapeptide) pyrophosphoryl-undecaprenol N-acetylglucosamine transferase [Candidatus Omnitrophica bacterium]|nr:UDP-N-acetylglucosamine--N-acetylmuramyl-(pentapeptide) pyrophosphoryl-undecaprenol N-acetylglucosamine transferase [Candidatus Omnitrophota bacterium]
MRVLAVSGSSGGHIFPALSFLDALEGKAADLKRILLLPRNSKKYRISSGGLDIGYISIVPVGLSLQPKNLLALFKFFYGALESLILLIRFRPDLVVGFGTISSVPVLFFAWLLRIKTLIHEQNVLPGAANKLLAKFADRVAVSFDKTRDYLDIDPDKIITTGNPLRRQLKRVEKERALDYFSFSGDKFTLLVMGGSSGSHNININFLDAISKFKDPRYLRVIHIAGSSDRDFLERGYRNFNVEAKVFSFFQEIEYAYSVSSLALCRGGASTIAELVNFGLPAIIIPYPFAWRHQSANAGVLENAGCAFIIDDAKLNGNLLKDQIEGFYRQPQRLKDMRLAYGVFGRINAASALADEALSLGSL